MSFDPLQHTGEVTLDYEQLELVLSYFGRYVRGYYKQEMNPGANEGISDMIEGWEDFKAMIGERKALQVFWTWARNLETFKTGMCDPDGN